VNDPLDLAARLIRAARHITLLSGSGLSAASGLATFRGSSDSLWHRHSAPDDAFAAPERWLSAEHFAAHPERLWAWHLALLAEYRQAAPNAGHLAVTDLQRFQNARGGALHVHTQNIDSLHEQAGTQDVTHLHGRLDRWRSLGSREQGDTGSEVPVDLHGYGTRPDITWFAEALPLGVMERVRSDLNRSGLLIVVGSSLAVSPVNHLPYHAEVQDIPVLYLGPERPAITFSHLHLKGNAETLLPTLVHLLGQPQTGPDADPPGDGPRTGPATPAP